MLTRQVGVASNAAMQQSSNLATQCQTRSPTPSTYSRIAIAWDYVEVNPFNQASGGAEGNSEWITRFIGHESVPDNHVGVPARVSHVDGASMAFPKASVSCVVTDPPYFDAIAYANLSDMFYVWLKQQIGNTLRLYRPHSLPKREEATALKHRHGGDGDKAEEHFIRKLGECFAESRRVCKPDGVISVMFAHQSTSVDGISSCLDAGAEYRPPSQSARAEGSFPHPTGHTSRVSLLNHCCLPAPRCIGSWLVQGRAAGHRASSQGERQAVLGLRLSWG